MNASSWATLRPWILAAARAGRSARRAGRRSRRSRRRTRWRLPSCSSTTRLATSLMKSRSWLTSTIAPAYCARKPVSHSTDARSRWLRRLVEQQDVGVLEQQPRERHAHHPAAAEGADVALHVAVGESEPGEDAARLGLQSVAAERLEPMLDAAVLVHQLGELGIVVDVLELLSRCGASAARSR